MVNIINPVKLASVLQNKAATPPQFLGRQISLCSLSASANDISLLLGKGIFINNDSLVVILVEVHVLKY